MRKRWTISFDDGATFSQEITPINAGSVKWAWTRRVDAGQLFRRKKLASELVFSGSDYNLLYTYERQPSQRCVRLYIRQERECSGLWSTFWTGRFSGGSCRWDHSHCSLSVVPETVDKYTCFLDHMEDRVNALSVGPYTANAVIEQTYEWGIGLGVFLDPDSVVLYVGDNVGAFDSATQTFEPGWAVAHTTMTGGIHGGPALFEAVMVLWREKILTLCIDGVPVPPAGSGWTLLTDDCAGSGTATYVRVPTAPYTYGDPVLGTCYSGLPVAPATPCAGVWIPLIGCPPTVYESTLVVERDLSNPYFICFDATPVVYDSARRVEDVLSLLIERMGCSDLAGVRSDFFEINPIGDAVGYSPGVNYVTGLPNTVNHLLLLQKSDAVFPTASQPAVLGELTMKVMLQWFRQMFRVYWDIDDNGGVRLEHYSFFTQVEELDLTVGDGGQRNRSLAAYIHLQVEAPKRERYSNAEQRTPDFVGADIVFDEVCAQGEMLEVVVENLTTDITYINGQPDAIDLRGFVMLAAEEIAGAPPTYEVYFDLGILIPNNIANQPLSWSALQDAFFRHDRPLATGQMNRQDTTFASSLPSIEQVPLTARMCCDLIFWNGDGTVKTELGESFLVGRQGIVEKAELDDATNVLTLTLRYAY